MSPRLESSTLLDKEFIAKIEQLELVSRKIASGQIRGERRSKRRGQSNEFADYRPYSTGDDLRFLDWNIYGRLERLFLRLYEEEEDLNLNILIDSSSSMGFGEPNKFLYARKIAAALAYIGLVNQDRVRVSSFNEQLEPLFGPARGRRQLWKLLDSLETVDTGKETGTNLFKGCKDFAVTQRLTGIVIFVSDFFDRRGFEEALKFLLAGRNLEIYVFHVLAPEEIDPKYVGDLRLVDCEDGIEADVSISRPLLKAYKRNLNSFRAEIQEYCTGRGMHYSFTSTEVPFDKLILGYLRRRGLLR